MISLREQVEFWQKEAAGRRDDMANYTRIVSETIDRLNVEVSKLTKERDIKEHCITQFELEDLRMKEQLAALAEQNKKLKDALENHNGNYKLTRAECAAINAILSLPDLATPVLNKYRADELEK